jgi:predicted alpha/beta-hydrolase family hydrolase
MAEAKSLTIEAAGQRVSALLTAPAGARAIYVVGHGAGVGMHHTFMQAVADGLAERGIATLRYQFPYMERGDKRPDPPKIAQATVRAAVEEAARAAPGLALFAGGKSYGGRMTSQAQAAEPLAGVKGIAFLGFPLHPPGQPSEARSEHLFNVKIPMLFLQGTRDKLADLALLKPIVERIGPAATLGTFEGVDHSFHVPKGSGKTDAGVMRDLLDALAQWIQRLS